MTLSLLDVGAIVVALALGAVLWRVALLPALQALYDRYAPKAPRERICRALAERGLMDVYDLQEATGIEDVEPPLSALVAGKLVALEPIHPSDGGPIYSLTKHGQKVLESIDRGSP